MKTNKVRKSISASISVLVLVLLTGIFCIQANAQTIVRGDMNNDSKVDVDDALYLLRHTLMPNKYPINQPCDLDGNGTVDVNDAIYLLLHTLLPDHYPLSCEHDLGEWVQTNAPNCTEKGEEKSKCKNCDYIETREVAAIGHKYADGVCENCGQKKPSDGLAYTYTLYSEGCYVSGIGTCTDNDIVIPAEYNGKPVTSIGYGAFSGCTDLAGVTIGSGMTNIGSNTFRGCTGLTSIEIPGSVTSIGYGAFSDTAYYNNSDNWSDGVLYIGNCLIEAQSD
ncbi:MAG: leucine-rich repeat protein, partial [Eubacteriales bacterium]